MVSIDGEMGKWGTGGGDLDEGSQNYKFPVIILISTRDAMYNIIINMVNTAALLYEICEKSKPESSSQGKKCVYCFL